MLAAAEEAGVLVGFYGGSQAVLDSLADAVRRRHPKLNIAFIESPPFRALTPEEDRAAVVRIASSGVQLLFVGLGCPKQEHWIVEHLGRVYAVMFAVGAAFDLLAGNQRRAPRWMRRCGLEWSIASHPSRGVWPNDTSSTIPASSSYFFGNYSPHLPEAISSGLPKPKYLGASLSGFFRPPCEILDRSLQECVSCPMKLDCQVAFSSRKSHL